MWYNKPVIPHNLLFYLCGYAKAAVGDARDWFWKRHGGSKFMMERPQFDMVASGQKMREIRKARNISVKQVMEYMGFESTQAVYKWESGKCYPQADNLLALAMLYHVNPMELLVEDGSLSSSFFVENMHCEFGIKRSFFAHIFLYM